MAQRGRKSNKNVSSRLPFPVWPVLFGLITFVLKTLAHFQPEWVERWYSRGLFQGVRFVLDWTLGLLPFPPFYLFWIAVVAFWIAVYRRRPPLRGRWPELRFWLLRMTGFAGLVYGLFFWLWGFNYARVPLPEQLGLEVQPLDSIALWQELEVETRALDSLRRALVGNDSAALEDARFRPDRAEDTVRLAVERWLAAERFPVGGRVRARFLYPQGLLFKFGASGIYWPFTGEGNLEGGLHALRRLPNMAHEMSHGYGFADEGVCNFIAYAACWDHPNAYVAYCARLDYWDTLAGLARWRYRARYDSAFVGTIHPGILADERAIRRQHDKFRELAPKLRYRTYDAYLKAQGVEAGMGSYGEVVGLVRAWRGR
jgi:hypothetical protein